MGLNRLCNKIKYRSVIEFLENKFSADTLSDFLTFIQSQKNIVKSFLRLLTAPLSQADLAIKCRNYGSFNTKAYL